MAESKNQIPRWREWLSEKLNPAQPSIASLEPYASPESIVDFEQAYREVEIVNRAVEMCINVIPRDSHALAILIANSVLT